MNTVEEVPLHLDSGRIGGPDTWWACERPEAHFDVKRTKIDLRCRACVIGSIAHMRRDGVVRTTRDEHGQVHNLQDMLEEAVKVNDVHSMVLSP